MAWAREVIVYSCIGVAGTRLMARNEREMCNYFAQCISVTDQEKINEQDKSIGTGPHGCFEMDIRFSN